MPERHLELACAIDAPVERVWRLLIGVADYGWWNPFIVGVDAPEGVEVGRRIRMHVRFPDGHRTQADERIEVVSPPGPEGACFGYRYQGPLARLNLVRARRLQTLTPRGGGCVYRTTEVFSGAFAPFIPQHRIRAGFEAQAQARRWAAASPRSAVP